MGRNPSSPGAGPVRSAFFTRRHWLATLMWGLAVWTSGLSVPGHSRADDTKPPSVADDSRRAALHLLPPDSVLILHLDEPKRLVENALIRDVIGLLNQASFRDEVLRRLDNPQIQQVKQFLEFTLDKPWDQALGALTAKGVTVGLGRAEGGFTPSTAILACDTEETVKRLRDAVFGIVFTNAGGPKKMEENHHRGVQAFQLDEGHVAFSGTRVIFANRRELLEGAVDRLLDEKSRTDFQIPATLDWTTPRTERGAQRRPVFTTWFNLEAARADEKFRKGIELPTDNIQAVLLLGGYVDLLRRARFVSAALFADDQQLELSLRADVGREGMLGKLADYFAPPAGESPTPRLEIEGEIASLSWTRDYGAIWESREQILKPETIQKLEEESKRAGLSGFPGALDFFSGLGREWSLVTTLPENTGYAHPANPQYPAGALLVSLKDETLFREKIFAPLNKFLDNPALSAFMKLETVTHSGVELRHAKFLMGDVADPFADANKGPTEDAFQRTLRSFDPALGVYRGRFLFATNLELAKKIIDARDKALVQDGPNAGSERVLLGPVAQVADYYKSYLLRQAVLKSGQTVEEAEADYALVVSLLRRLGSLRRETRLETNLFEMRHVLGETPVLSEEPPVAP